MEVGKSVRRVDAFDKATGRAKYCDDLCDRSALVARVLHSTIANGVVKSIDTSAAEQIEGVVKVVTCFDVPQIKFPTAGHPWSTDPHHQDVADRLLLTSRVRFYGDDIAAVVAENEVAAAQALRALRVEYEEYPFVLDVQEAMKPDAPLLHEEFPNNILAHTTIRNGNYEQDALYEPLCAYLSTVVGGRLVKLDCTREETFVCNRVRHAIRTHIISWVRPDGTFAARKIECFSNQGAYASHGHGIVAKGMGAFPQLYPCPNVDGDAYTVFTNRPAAGAMRGYGIPQAMFAGESHIEDVCRVLGVDSLEYRRKHMMPVGFVDGFSKNENHSDTLNQVLDKGEAWMDYSRKHREYENQTGPVRRGVGCALFWYNTAVWPISLESCSCRMVLNQDGSIQLQTGETEIGQGCDTAFAQMAADAVGIPVSDVHVVTAQDTDVTPFGTGAYASRQTYVGGFAIAQTGALLKERILKYACELTRQMPALLDIVDGRIIRRTDGRVLMTLGELATEALYSLSHSEHLTAESTYQIKNNAYSFGCSFAEVEVDIPLCKVKLLKLINVHDCGKLINPQLAEAQVHGGMSMAIGYGMSEELKFDPKTGRPLNNNLLDYKLSTMMDHPHLEAQFVENAEPTNPYGTKALGEPPACSGAPAIRNAILNATGIGIDVAPITPHVLFAAFEKAGLFEKEETAHV